MNTVKQQFKNVIFKKGYWNAPFVDMSGFEYVKKVCPSCNQEKTLFAIAQFQEFHHCCMDCLLEKDFHFDHDTEAGIITDEDGIMIFEDDEPATFEPTKAQIKEMKLTPDFWSYQGEKWLTHCNDFMIFKGIWQPSDFTSYSPNNNGKKLFLEMTDEDYNHLWDEIGLEENETEYSWEDDDVQYYAFECKHCKKLKGNWDMG